MKPDPFFALARHHYGPAGAGIHIEPARPDRDSNPDPVNNAAEDSSIEPSRLAAWSEFHRQINTMPDEEREVFDLVYYQSLTHAQAAKLLEVSTKTIQRRWQMACEKLHEKLGGNLPDL